MEDRKVNRIRPKFFAEWTPNLFAGFAREKGMIPRGPAYI
jgi:hypothetical protein